MTTHVQLYRQLERLGHPRAAIERAHAGYCLAAELFSGIYRPDGRTFIEHSLSVASAAAGLARPIDTVLGGLLHAVYSHGDFGGFVRGPRPRRRAAVRAAIGERGERYASLYRAMRWGPQRLSAIAAELAGAGDEQREVVLLHLVNELDDHADLGVLYARNAEHRREVARARLELLPAMARELGQPGLAGALAAALAAVVAGAVPTSLMSPFAGNRAVIPRSQRATALELARTKVGPVYRRLRGALVRRR